MQRTARAVDLRASYPFVGSPCCYGAAADFGVSVLVYAVLAICEKYKGA